MSLNNFIVSMMGLIATTILIMIFMLRSHLSIYLKVRVNMSSKSIFLLESYYWKQSYLDFMKTTP